MKIRLLLNITKSTDYDMQTSPGFCDSCVPNSGHKIQNFCYSFHSAAFRFLWQMRK